MMMEPDINMLGKLNGVVCFKTSKPLKELHAMLSVFKYTEQIFQSYNIDNCSFDNFIIDDEIKSNFQYRIIYILGRESAILDYFNGLCTLKHLCYIQLVSKYFLDELLKVILQDCKYYALLVGYELDVDIEEIEDIVYLRNKCIEQRPVLFVPGNIAIDEDRIEYFGNNDLSKEYLLRYLDKLTKSAGLKWV